ncbi:MAG: MoxR family ATPase [Pseudomonadota bacterium]
MDAIKEKLPAPGLSEALESKELEWARVTVLKLINTVGRIIKGKNEPIKMMLIGLMCRGHVLIEDIPGVGKTTLAKALARAVGGSFRRIQFTSDLMPSDIIGISVYRQNDGEFLFKPGPIFASIVLADEINRTNPRTQSALLEAMNERQVTVDGATHALAEPFIVIATQNPHDFYGTYPLPESQLDRFLIRIQLGYPDLDTEKQVVCSGGTDELLEDITPVIELEDVIRLSGMVEQVKFDAILLDYLMEIVSESRKERTLSLGISPRGAIHLFRAAQAAALIEGRGYAIPDDLQSVMVPVLSHRLIPSGAHTSAPAERRKMAEQVIKEILDKIPVPV